MGEEVEGLEDDADLGPPKLRRVGLAELIDPLARDFDFAGIGAIVMGSTTYEWVVEHLKSSGEKWMYEMPAWVMTTRDLEPFPGADIRFASGGVRAVYDELRADKPKRHFTVGIRDDITHLSLPFDTSFDIEPDDVVRAVFWGLGADGTVGANKNSIKIVGEPRNETRSASSSVITN